LLIREKNSFYPALHKFRPRSTIRSYLCCKENARRKSNIGEVRRVIISWWRQEVQTNWFLSCSSSSSAWISSRGKSCFRQRYFEFGCNLTSVVYRLTILLSVYSEDLVQCVYIETLVQCFILKTLFSV